MAVLQGPHFNQIPAKTIFWRKLGTSRRRRQLPPPSRGIVGAPAAATTATRIASRNRGGYYLGPFPLSCGALGNVRQGVTPRVGCGRPIHPGSRSPPLHFLPTLPRPVLADRYSRCSMTAIPYAPDRWPQAVGLCDALAGRRAHCSPIEGPHYRSWPLSMERRRRPHRADQPVGAYYTRPTNSTIAQSLWRGHGPRQRMERIARPLVPQSP